MKAAIIIFIATLAGVTVSAQPARKIDSLNVAYQKATNDTVKANAIHALFEAYLSQVCPGAIAAVMAASSRKSRMDTGGVQLNTMRSIPQTGTCNSIRLMYSDTMAIILAGIVSVALVIKTRTKL